MIRNALIVAVACVPAWVRAQSPKPLEATETKQATGSPASRAGKDVVALTSGNRLTGTVGELSRGQLSFSIDGAGAVDISWSNVETLESTQRLDIELASGERLSGSIASAAAGTLNVTTGVTPRTIDMKDVVRMTPVHATLRERTAGSVDFGFDFLNANDEFDLTLNGEANNRTRNYLTEASLSLLVRRFDGETAQRRNLLQLGSRRFGHNRWFGLGKLEVEQNRKLDLDLRTLLGAAPGRTLIQSNGTVLSVYAGLDYLRTDYRGIPGTDNSAEALASVEGDWTELGGGTGLSVAATTYAGLGDSHTRFELASSVRRDIFRNFYLSLNLYQSYNSNPPLDLAKSDFGLGLTVGRSF